MTTLPSMLAGYLNQEVRINYSTMVVGPVMRTRLAHVDIGVLGVCNNSVPLDKILSVHFNGNQVWPELARIESYEDTINDIIEWQEKTFPLASVAGIKAHLRREVEELRTTPDIASEIADVFILTVGLANLASIDLHLAVKNKMEINKQRTWQKPDAHGVIEHVRTNLDSTPAIPIRDYIENLELQVASMTQSSKRLRELCKIKDETIARLHSEIAQLGAIILQEKTK